MENIMTNGSKILISSLLAAVLSAGVVAQTAPSARFDGTIQQSVQQRLQQKQQFRGVQSSVEDGIVTLTGTVGIYQDKLDAAKRVRKLHDVQGVRNLIAVAGPAVSDTQLATALQRKLYYDRMGYDNRFNYVTVSVQNSVATLQGETLSDVGRDSALAIAQRMPGVKDVVDNIRVSPVSTFDDDIRIRASRALYRDTVLSRYANDPARPIRIVVSNGKLALYGTVDNQMDKQIAGIRAGQVFGVFSVQNNLSVAKQS